MRKNAAKLLFLPWLAGCSLFTTTDHEARPEPEVVKVIRPAPIPPKRILGSLWTENSRWNDFYSAQMGRGLGDIILFKPSDAFRSEVAARAGHGYDQGGNSRENNNVIGRIKEVLPRQVYVVEADQMLRVGTRDHKIAMLGKVREQDIAADDIASTDQVFDLKLDVTKETFEDVRKVNGMDINRMIEERNALASPGPTPAPTPVVLDDKEKEKKK